MTKRGLTTFTLWWRENDLWVLLSLYFLSLPIGKTLWLPLLIMSVTGIAMVIQNHKRSEHPKVIKVLLIAAIAFYLPALLSLPDSLVLSRTLEYLFTFPLFAAVGYFLTVRIASQGFPLVLLNILTAIVLLWSVAAFIQFLFPSISPFPAPAGGRFQGIFGRKDMILGYVLAPMIPLLVALYWQRGKRVFSVALLIALATTCFLSGNRASWVSVLIMLGAGILVLWRIRTTLSWKQILPISALASIALVVGLQAVSGSSVERRLKYTLEFFQNPSFESFDRSSAGRGELWATAVKIGLANPWNGTGVGNFRYAYPYYAPENTHWKYPNPDESSPHRYTGAMYTHQIVLQQFANTGVPGLLGIFVFYFLLTSITLKSVQQSNLIVSALALAVWMGFFPINTHLNISGGWLTASLWVWLGLLFGAMERSDRISVQAG